MVAEAEGVAGLVQGMGTEPLAQSLIGLCVIYLVAHGIEHGWMDGEHGTTTGSFKLCPPPCMGFLGCCMDPVHATQAWRVWLVLSRHHPAALAVQPHCLLPARKCRVSFFRNKLHVGKAAPSLFHASLLSAWGWSLHPRKIIQLQEAKTNSVCLLFL